MSIARALYGIRPVKSTSKYGRSNRRHFARQNHRKKTSIDYEKKFRNAVLSQFSADNWIPCPSGYTRGQGWNCLFRAWLGYKIANNPRNGESFQDRLGWAITIQNIQTDLGLQRSSFPNLGLFGDYVFAYDKEKKLELQTEEDELWFKEYKRKKSVHIKEIVDTSFLTEEEKQMMREEFGPAMQKDAQNRYMERIIMPNFFDVPKNYHG
jgi:hypothetical protein